MSAEPPEVKSSDGFFIGRKGRMQRKVKKKPFHQKGVFHKKSEKRGYKMKENSAMKIGKLGFLVVGTVLLVLMGFSTQSTADVNVNIGIFASPAVYEFEVHQDISVEEPIISSLPEEENNSPIILTDYNHNVLAVKAVERNINLFTERMSEKFSLWLSRSGKYTELMREILRGQNVPEEIVFIPLIESGFSPYACSPARAVGYWQFIASTAKKYGLKINWWMDERRDPVKSTVAAANYFKDLYEMFGSWNLAMAAYNAGEGKILKAINRTNTNDYWSLLGTKYLKRETKDYVPKFIAASLIAKNPKEFGFEELEYHQPLNYDEVTIDAPVDLQVIAECAETTFEVIKELNPELRRWCTPPDLPEYTLRVPEGKKDVFLQNLSLTPEEERFSFDIYKARKGDTFKKISKKTGIPVQVILDLNSLEKIIPLKAGMKIYLPPKGKFVLDREDKSAIKRASLKQRGKAVIKSRKANREEVIKKASFNQKEKVKKNRDRKI
jgi:membrane-bound lytic murein transglycosylase D